MGVAMTRPWTITKQPDRYGFQGPVPTIGCTVGLDAAPRLVKLVCRACGEPVKVGIKCKRKGCK